MMWSESRHRFLGSSIDDLVDLVSMTSLVCIASNSEVCVLYFFLRVGIIKNLEQTLIVACRFNATNVQQHYHLVYIHSPNTYSTNCPFGILSDIIY